MYGIESADTATSWNNQACCLYCLHHVGMASILFEKATNIFVQVLGRRHPRSVVGQKNLEKSTRSQTIVHSSELKAAVSMRNDVDRLLLGGDFTINAFPPIEKPAKTTVKTVIKKKK
jgi:hypothetical protein